MHKTHKNLHIIIKCVGISNCHKWFEIMKIGIISHSQNIMNHIHTWTCLK
jgi:hypothetical protein